ncbi:hypothetical protein FS749_011885 [Ceratobasidium sp. UAMH 11750]|nr:hypothetical protein FS749_011885 [Ceratobasidium sp. UAMH 11750]
MANSMCKIKPDKSLSQPLSTVLRIVLHLNKTTSFDESQYRKLAKKFSKACETDAGLWIAYLGAELGANRPRDSELVTPSSVRDLPEAMEKMWAEARGKAEERSGEEDLLVDLWSWGIRQIPEHPESLRRADLWKARSSFPFSFGIKLTSKSSDDSASVALAYVDKLTLHVAPTPTVRRISTSQCSSFTRQEASSPIPAFNFLLRFSNGSGT